MHLTGLAALLQRPPACPQRWQHPLTLTLPLLLRLNWCARVVLLGCHLRVSVAG